MRSAVIALILGFGAASCSPDPEVAASTNKCATALYPSYNPKSRDQCVDVCIKCNHGVTVTCSTSCMLKGAR
jgi:hypothetical protein